VKSVAFRREREASWTELATLLDRVERQGLRALSAIELMRLPVLYRAVLSSLSVARAISLDQNAVDYLESLAQRAYFCVYAAKRHPGRTIVHFFAYRFPQAVRTLARPVVLAALLMTLGALTGRGLTLADADRFYAFVDEGYAQGRSPAASTEDLRAVLYHGSDSSLDLLAAFATFLFTHNARVGMLCSALGFAAAIPSVLLIFQNGVVLGAFSALYEQRSLGFELWGWLLPHGVTELLAVVLCGGAGIAMGEAVLFPGRHTRLHNLALCGKEAGAVVIGSLLMFLLAGLLEGIFRQVVHDVLVRYLVAIASVAFWGVYFVLSGRESR
jgi:uncharacterized membrane protein SpoIIM required for sporulation